MAKKDQFDALQIMNENIKLYVKEKITEAQISGGQVDLSNYVTKTNGNANQITFADGQTFQAKLDAGILKGDKGDQGPQGEKGDTGEQGPQGIQGLKGDKGEKAILGHKENKVFKVFRESKDHKAFQVKKVKKVIPDCKVLRVIKEILENKDQQVLMDILQLKV